MSGAPPGSSDPFGAAAQRAAVLDAWRASPDRLREDANTEADLVAGAYRDRAVVELAQNAADAAARAGVPGDLLLRLDDAAGEHGALVAANTGAPLDAAGVRALASLRASAKRAPSPVEGAHGGTGTSTSTSAVGRFGVGFAAVLALTDEPQVLSTGGGVAFSRRRTREVVAATGSQALDREVGARSGDVPVLRLPWPHDTSPPHGYDTAVVLPLRDAGARERALAALSAVGDVLLLALPALRRITVEAPGAPRHVVEDVASRWATTSRGGAFAGADLGVLPVEERQRAARDGWSLTWALPRDPAAADLPGVLLAPTPTDEPLPWPAALIVGAPLDATRRTMAPGPSTGVVLDHAARAYADLLAERAARGEDALDLVPSGLASGQLDADLRTRLLDLLPAVRLLRPVDAPAGDGREGRGLPEDGAEPGAGDTLGAPLLRPREAVVLDGPLGDDTSSLAALAQLVGGLVAAPLRHRGLLAALGASTTSVADVVDAMPLRTDAATWRGWARALAGVALDPAGREQLALLPVPLAGDRAVRGPRGLLLPPALASSGAPGAPSPAREALATLAAAGLRVVDPELLVNAEGGVGSGPQRADASAAADLLAALGAVPASARAVLEDPSVARAITAADPLGGEATDGLGHDVPGAGEVADAVLTLVTRALEDGELRPGDLPALGELLLPADDGEVWPAAGLVLPGSAAARLLDPEEVAPVAADVLDRWGAPALEAVGVAAGLGVVRLGEVDADDPPDALLDVDGGQEWLEQACPDGGTVADVVLVRDLDLVLPERRDELLALVAGDPVLRAAVLEPVRVIVGGVAASARSHAAWWLGHELRVAGRADPSAPGSLRTVLGEPDGALAAAEPALRRALGTVDAWEQVPADAWGAVLERSLRGGLDVPGLLALWAALAAAARGGAASPPDGLAALDAPDRLAALDAAGAVVVARADEVVVVDDPRWLQVTLGPRLVVGADDALALADVLDVDLASERGEEARVVSTGATREVPALVRAAVPDAPSTWMAHERLSVDVVGANADVGWWLEDGILHADGLRSLACGLAAAAGAWGRRHVLAEVLLALSRGDHGAAAVALATEAAGS